MTSVVLDASALLESLRRGPGMPEVRGALLGGRTYAPVVLDAEVLSGLRRWLFRGWVDEPSARRMLAACRSAPIERAPLDDLLADAWTLRENARAFDALYVALARVLGARLVTADARLAAAPGLGVPVTLLPT
jgi:predicted nucleic acid-binding protein